jgi:hypothetical protein
MASIQLVPVEREYVKQVTDKIEQFISDLNTNFSATVTNIEPDDEIMNDDGKLVVIGELIPIRAVMKIYKEKKNLTTVDTVQTKVIGRGWCIISPTQPHIPELPA